MFQFYSLPPPPRPSARSLRLSRAVPKADLRYHHPPNSWTASPPSLIARGGGGGNIYICIMGICRFTLEWWDAAGLGFVCFIVINPRVLSVSRVYLDFFGSYFSNVYSPFLLKITLSPPPPRLIFFYFYSHPPQPPCRRRNRGCNPPKSPGPTPGRPRRPCQHHRSPSWNSAARPRASYTKVGVEGK